MQWQQEHSWYAYSTDESIGMLESDGHHGLTSEEAERRLQAVGRNVVSGKSGPSAFVRLLQQFNNPLIIVLLVSGTITVFLKGHLVDAAVIFGVVLINAIIGFVQETKAHAAIEALKELVRVETMVTRDGVTRRVAAEVLVPGDLVQVQSGDRIPADMRILRHKDLHVDESMLTGESLPVAKEYTPFPVETPLADRKNIAYSGTLVTFGQATGLVVATGQQTELGRISHLIETTTELATPLTHRLSKFSLVIAWVITGFAVIAFGLGILRGDEPVQTFIGAVAFAVAAIPEGLPAVVTIILAIGVTRMAQQHAVIRKMPAVETLGSTSVICSDKTGTLTKNEMTVTMIVANNLRYQVTGIGYAPTGELRLDETVLATDELPRPLRETLYAGVLCNDARLHNMDGHWKIEGDSTEGALLVAAMKAGIDPGDLRDRIPAIDVIPFESERQYMATLHAMPDGGSVIYVKGAVEKLLALCPHMLDLAGQPGPIPCARLQQDADTLASEGLRVLAFAMKPGRDGQETLHPNDIDQAMILLGLQGMIDPPRQEAIQAVRACQHAGITVKMITGDHALTAKTIARQIGIATEDSPALTGVELAKIDDADLPDHVANTNVFARVAPEQKLKLVRALQARSAVVAMTGDGVNDAPALKQANIGIAMGITGTEAAKDAADMVLTDDNFASIEAAVEEGRGVYNNLRKFITWTLPTNMGQGLLLLIAIVFNLALPVLPVQVLWINMTTAVALGTMLAFEPKEHNLMQEGVRHPKEPLLTPDLIARTLYVSALIVIGAFVMYEYELARGASLAETRTIVTSVVVMAELAFLFNCRSLTEPVTRIGLFSNPWVIIGSLVMILLQLVYTYVPAMNTLFETAPIPAIAWLEIASIAVAVFIIVEMEKWVRRRRAGATGS